MRFLWIMVVGMLITITACQQSKTPYEAWQEEEKTEIRFLPEYGNKPKSDGQKAADKEFIKTVLAADGSLEKGSEKYVEIGFQYFRKGDLRHAMYRFNQAWLLNPKNPSVYWGFGSVYFAFEDYKKAIEQYDKGLKLDAKHPGLLKDKAVVEYRMKK